MSCVVGVGASGRAGGRAGPGRTRPARPPPPGLPDLRGLPGHLSLRGDVDLDRPRLCLLTKRELHGEDAVLVLGRDLVRVDGLRQRERAAERTVAPLDVVVLLVLHFGRRFLLAVDRQHEVLDVDLDVVAIHIGQFGFQHELVFAALEDVDRWHPGTRRREPEIAKWIPTDDSHKYLLCFQLFAISCYFYFVSAYSASTTSASFTFDPA